MKPFDTIGIIGAGLIGGSLGLAIKRAKLAGRVIGVSRHAGSIARARRLKAVDSASLDLAAVREADLVILATPVATIIGLADRLAAVLKPGCIVVDTGSTKVRIVKTLGRKFSSFVGCHPIAGSEKRGVDNARADLFKGALCIFTPVASTPPAALRKAQELFKALGARTCSMSPEEHDRALAAISHLPHCLAFALANATPQQYLAYAGNGFRDMTRIAASDARVWEDILCTNSAAILRSIGAFEQELLRLKRAILAADATTIRRLLLKARQKRQRIS